MRRLVLILLVIGLGVPAGALAVRELPGDGSLVVDNARGLVVVRARGGIIGRFDSGRITIEDPIGGVYKVTVNGYGVDGSAVGRCTVTLDGSGFTEQPGRFQINGSGWQPMPDDATRYTLGTGVLPASVAAPDKSSDKEKPGPSIPHGQ